MFEDDNDVQENIYHVCFWFTVSVHWYTVVPGYNAVFGRKNKPVNNRVITGDRVITGKPSFATNISMYS